MLRIGIQAFEDEFQGLNRMPLILWIEILVVKLEEFPHSIDEIVTFVEFLLCYVFWVEGEVLEHYGKHRATE